MRLLHVVDDLLPVATTGYCADDLLLCAREAGQEILDTALAKARAAGVQADGELLEHVGGGSARFILDVAAKRRADLIVLGTHGRRGLRRLVMGSDAEEVVRTSNVPVLLVREA